MHRYPILFSALSLTLVSPAVAQQKQKKLSTAEEIATLKSELKALQEALQNATEGQQSSEAKQQEQQEKYNLLTAQLEALANQADPENETLRAELAASNARTAALERELRELSEKLQESQQKDRGLQFFGYFSAIARYLDLPDITDAEGNIDDKRDFDFFNNIAELDFDRSYQDKAYLRVDLDAAFNPQGGGRAFLLEVEQAYVQLNRIFEKELTVSFGRLNTPWGFEPVDAPGNYCVTRSNLFQLIRPKLMTGALASYALSEHNRASLYVINGLEDNFDVKNNAKTFGARVDLASATTTNNTWSLGFNALAGSEQPTAFIQDKSLLGLLPDPTLLLGIDYQQRQGKLLVGGDLLFGTIYNAQNALEANLGANHIAAVNLTLHYDFGPRLGYTFRYDALRDSRGALLGASAAVPLYPARPTDAAPDANLGGTLHSVTADLNFNLLPNTTTQTFFELRLDRMNPTEDAVPSKSAATASMQFIYNY